MCISYNPAILLLGIHHKERAPLTLHKNVLTSTLYTSNKPETSPVHAGNRTHAYDEASVHHGILYKEGSGEITYEHHFALQKVSP